MPRSPTFPFVKNVSIRGPLFEAADCLEIARIVTPSTELLKAELMARLINRVFNGAIGMAEHDEVFLSPNVLKKYYNAVIADARALAEALGLPTAPSELLTQETGRKPRVLPLFSRPLKAPTSLDWLLRGANPPGTVALIEVAGLPAKPLVTGKPASAVADDDFWQLAAIAEVAASAPELAAQLGLLDSLGVRSPDTKEELRGYEAIRACLAVMPHVLALVIGLSERAKRTPSRIPDKTNYQRTFFREIFLGLADVHHMIFGVAPLLQNNERDPAGSGVSWARKILRLAADRIEANLVDSLQRDQDGRVNAVHAVKAAANLSDWTIADRIREGAGLRSSRRNEHGPRPGANPSNHDGLAPRD